MGIFNKLFAESKHKDTRPNPFKWNNLTTLEQLSEVTERSHQKPVLIFKHSTRCSISRMALKQFENHYTLSEDELSLFFLDLLEYREISNQIASEFAVVHQSPQILLIKNGQCVYTASHSDIDAEELTAKISGLA